MEPSWLRDLLAIMFAGISGTALFAMPFRVGRYATDNCIIGILARAQNPRLIVRPPPGAKIGPDYSKDIRRDLPLTVSIATKTP
jgi:hypothetical protein